MTLGRASWWMDLMFGTSTRAGWCRPAILAALQSAMGLLALGGVAAAQQVGPGTAAALAPATPDYFRALLPMFAKAPRPAKIYQQGGIPALVPKLEVDWNPFGKVGTYLPGGPISTADNAFFQAFGTNGRSCATCHQPSSGMGLSLRNVRARFTATAGRDPLFASVDGADCPSALATDPEAATRRDLHAVILNRASIRIPLPWPPRDGQGKPKPVEFDITITPQEDKPGCNVDLAYGLEAGFVSVYRRPLMSAQLNFKTLRPGGRRPILPGSLMWDGREPSLEQQAINATLGHAQATRAPTPAQLRQMVQFQSKIFSAQLIDAEAGRLDADGAKGGPIHLYRQTPEQAFGPAFDEYDRWGRSADKRRSIRRGQDIFNNRLFIVEGVAGFNDRPDVGDLAISSCSTCHNTAHAGSDALANPQRDIGIGGTAQFIGGPKPAALLPRFTLICHADAPPHPYLGRGPIVTNDPGLALLTGRCGDIGKFTLPQLRALAAREPYFHDGSARTLKDVVDIYNRRFSIGLTARDQQDLINFLAAL